MRFGGLIAAIVFAAVAAVVVLRMSGPKEEVTTENAPQMTTTNVYVAATDIPIGSTISQEMVAIQPWPSHLVLDGFIAADAGINIVGMVGRASFQAQEPLLTTKLSNPADPNFLAGALPKGMRVVTLMTNEIEGVAGFVFPGDFIDIMLTHEVRKWVSVPATALGEAPTLAEETRKITETLLTNVKVLAVDQRASGASAVDKEGNLIIPRSVSLMVSPADAQRLRLGQQTGTLTLSLRALADRESADPLIVTGITDISQLPESEISGGSSGVMVVRGTASEASGSFGGATSGAAAGAVTPGPVAP